MFENGYSPVLSLATAAIELGAMVWALGCPGRVAVRRLCAALLAVLAGYQVLEVLICAQPSSQLQARLAFCDVIWLPPLALSLLGQLYGPLGAAGRGAIRLAWVCAVGLFVWMLVDHSFVVGAVCQTVLATYEHGTPFHHLFGAYYELALGGIIVGCALGMPRSDRALDRAHMADLQLGVLSFMIPAMLTQIIWKGLDPSLPSIMCHYALFLALFLIRLLRREASAHLGSGTG